MICDCGELKCQGWLNTRLEDGTTSDRSSSAPWNVSFTYSMVPPRALLIIEESKANLWQWFKCCRSKTFQAAQRISTFQLPSQTRRHALERKELWFGGQIFSPDKAAEVPASTLDCNSQVKWQRFSDYKSEIEHDPPPPGSDDSWLWPQLPLEVFPLTIMLPPDASPASFSCSFFLFQQPGGGTAGQAWLHIVSQKHGRLRAKPYLHSCTTDGITATDASPVMMYFHSYS